MPKQVQRRRGTTAAHASFTGAAGEFTYDTDLKCIRTHDGSTAGGFVTPRTTGAALTTGRIVCTTTNGALIDYAALAFNGTTLTLDGDLTFTGAQTISTSAGVLTITGTGGVTVTTASNGNILWSPHGTGFTSITSGNLKLSPVAAGSRYILLDGTDTLTGNFIVQAGGGSSGFGGGLILYSHSNASKPGWVTAGLSAASGGKFTVNTQGLGDGTDVFIVEIDGTISKTGYTQHSVLFSGASGAVSQDNANFSYNASTVALAVGGSADGSAILTLTSTTKGLLVPRMTTTQRDAISSPTNGLIIYNSSSDKFQGRAAAAWADFH